MACVVNVGAQAQHHSVLSKEASAISSQKILPLSDSVPKQTGKKKLLDSLEQAKRKMNETHAQLGSMHHIPTDSLDKQMAIPQIGDLIAKDPKCLTSAMDTLQFNKVEDVQRTVQEQIDNTVEKLSGEIGERDLKVNEKLGEYTTVPSKDKLVLPGNVSGDLEFPANGINNKLPVMPSATLPPTSDANIPSTNGVDVRGMFDAKIEKIQGLEGRVTESVADANEKVVGIENTGAATLTKVRGIQNETKNVEQIDVDGVTRNAEKKIEQSDAVQQVKRKVAPATQKQAEYEAMIKKYQDKKLAQQELQRKLGNVANDQINQFTPAVKNVMGDLEKNKKRWNDAKQLGDSVKRVRVNLMAGKPMGRRLVPGITFQVLNRSVYSMDLGAQVGYRFTNKLTAGIGGNYRVGISKQFEQYVQGMDVTSCRMYADVMIRSGWFPHAELELVNASRYNGDLARYEDADVMQTNVGVGKLYKLSKRLNGYALLLYRFEWRGEMQDQSKLNLRIGFNFDMKKRRTKVINDVRIKL